MAGTQPPHPLVCCKTGKIIYATDKEAQSASIEFKRRRHSGFSRRESALNTYYCNACDGFHLGHGGGFRSSNGRRQRKLRRYK